MSTQNQATALIDVSESCRIHLYGMYVRLKYYVAHMKHACRENMTYAEHTSCKGDSTLIN